MDYSEHLIDVRKSLAEADQAARMHQWDAAEKKFADAQRHIMLAKWACARLYVDSTR